MTEAIEKDEPVQPPGDDDDEETLQARHRKEKKDLQAKVQALKKSATKGDKKKKKEVAEEIAKLESEMETRHKSELQKHLAESTEVNSLSEKLEDTAVIESAVKNEAKVTKAQKRRDKKVDQAREREKLIEEQEKANKFGARHIETEKIRQILAKRELTFYEIPSDGNCMYAAILHQINPKGSTSGVVQSVQQLRNMAADFMRSHSDDFMPFMDEVSSQEEFIKYCNDVQRTAAWGSQLELRALSQVLRRPFEVVQAEGRQVVVGEEFVASSSSTSSEPPVLLTYHRHMFGLGEHYNSVQPRPVEDDDDQN